LPDHTQPAWQARLNELAAIASIMDGSAYDALTQCASIKSLRGPDLSARVLNIKEQLRSLCVDLEQMNAEPVALADALGSEIEAVNLSLDPIQQQLIDLLGQARLALISEGHVLGEWQPTAETGPLTEGRTLVLKYRAWCSKCSRHIVARLGLQAQVSQVAVKMECTGEE
jgi:hypothetical protein